MILNFWWLQKGDIFCKKKKLQKASLFSDLLPF